MGKHTACFPGKIVWVKLRNGEVFYDKFVSRQGGRNFVVLEKRGRLRIEDIRSFSMYRGPAAFMDKAIKNVKQQKKR